jgi:hypothetical protein
MNYANVLLAKAQVPHQFCAPALQYISFLYLLTPMLLQGKASETAPPPLHLHIGLLCTHLLKEKQ